MSRLNIIKILSHKSSKLTSKTLISIYKALVSSLFNYISFCANILSTHNLKKLQVIQNSAIRSIFYLPFDTPTEEIKNISNAPSVNLKEVNIRLSELNRRHIENAISNRNPLLTELCNDYIRSFNGRKCILKNKTPLCFHATLLENLNS